MLAQKGPRVKARHAQLKVSQVASERKDIPLSLRSTYSVQDDASGSEGPVGSVGHKAQVKSSPLSSDYH